MMQFKFADEAKAILKPDDNVIGLAVGGSWLTNEIDKYSDLDLILVTKYKVSDNKELMISYAKRLGDFLSGFTGEHVGEPRVLICLYDNPLLHVDIKFVTLEEFENRVENPKIILDKDGQLQSVLDDSVANFPLLDYQWIEDRFWTWIHYTLLKIGRGEYLEAFDFLGFLRMVVLGPLLHVKNGNLPRGVRKVETEIDSEDFNALKLTMPSYNRQALIDSLRSSVMLYKELRDKLFDDKVNFHTKTESSVMAYFKKIENNAIE